MRKWLNKPWFVGLLASLAIGAAVQSVLSDRPNYAASQPVAATEAPAAEEAAPTGSPETGEPASLSGIAAPVSGIGLRELFASPARNTAPDATDEARVATRREVITLSALWAQNGAVLCVVNGRICHPGDSVGAVVIESADLEGIWVSHSQGRSFVELGQSFTLLVPVSPSVIAAVDAKS